jgi:arylsulfatase A-like enzyme
MSSENGVLVNPLPLRDDIPDLGTWVSEHSAHESVYIGKWHVPGRDVRQSFDMLHPSSIGGEASDLSQVRTLEGFLQSRSPDAPFFATLSLLNPHDICMFLQAEWNATPADMLGLDPAELPPLPPNFHAPNDEPALFREVKRGTLPQATWPREKWQIYRWWYDRMVENVDGAIGRVLDLVWNSRWGEDTVIILSADHGDMQGEHKIVNKQTFYDASAKVPMIVAAPGRFPARGRDRRHLVSGVDVPSTVCELIGIDPPPLQRGRSLVPLLEGRATSWRDHLQVQTLVEGRVIRSQDYKYVTFRGDPKELLFDLRNDPWETDDLAEDSTYASVLEDHRRMQVEFEAQLENTALSDEGWHAARAARGI